MKSVIIFFTLLVLTQLILGVVTNEYECDAFKVKSNVGYHIITFNNTGTKFGVVEDGERDYDFYVNSNFFTKSADIIGGLVIDGENIKSQFKGGGSFTVKNGKPNIEFGRNNKVDHLSQSLVWIVKNNRLNTTMLAKDHANKKVMRLLLGKNKNNEIVLIHSNKFNLVTMKEIANVAQSVGITDAIILDSGSSVDLYISHEKYEHSIKAVPSIIKRVIGIDEPVAYIVGSFN